MLFPSDLSRQEGNKYTTSQQEFDVPEFRTENKHTMETVEEVVLATRPHSSFCGSSQGLLIGVDEVEE